jgi:1-phosphofructokinase family hexose kinase
LSRFLCVSPNPAIDKRIAVGSLLRGQVNRARTVRSFPGGKSAHVAMVLQTLGEKPRWVGTTGGTSGEELMAGLAAMGIQTVGIRTQRATRTNLEIVEDDGCVTEVLEPGLALGADEWQGFENECRKQFAENAENTLVIFSGSLPAEAPTRLYAGLIRMARQFGCKTLLDTSGDPLRLALAEKPDFVKPNREEVCRLLEKAIDSRSDAVSALHVLLSMGAQSAALSLGADGLLYCAGAAAPVLFAPVLPIHARSTVGAGDSALAGFAVGIQSGYTAEETLRLAAACGQANCVAESPGGAKVEDIRSFQERISVHTQDPTVPQE